MKKLTEALKKKIAKELIKLIGEVSERVGIKYDVFIKTNIKLDIIEKKLTVN